METVYLLHFDRKVAGHAQHYIGYTTLPLEDRLARHRTGFGAKLLRALKAEGGSFEVAMTQTVLPGEGKCIEEEFKRQRNHKRRCPICKAAAAEERRRQRALATQQDPALD